MCHVFSYVGAGFSRLFPESAIVFSSMRFIVAVALTVVANAACRIAGPDAPIVQPGPPGQLGRTMTAEQAAGLSRVQHTEADVRFMQGMIRHHAQALDMTALVPRRSRRDEIRLLAERIDASQSDEIRLMQRWLEVRGGEVPGPHAHHDAALMPGMLTPEQMGRLADASGAEFDRVFLEFMIKHHEGALVMVNELFSTPAAGQESEVFAFASDVVADQRMEIQRMGVLRKELQP